MEQMCFRLRHHLPLALHRGLRIITSTMIALQEKYGEQGQIRTQAIILFLHLSITRPRQRPHLLPHPIDLRTLKVPSIQRIQLNPRY